MKALKLLLALLLCCGIARAQQPQTNNPPAPIYAVNAKYVNGVAPGYWGTPGALLVLNLSAGTANCSGTLVTYAGGTLSMTGSTTNYVYLNVSSSCVPAVSTSSAVFATNIPIAVVTTTTVITSITDDRTMLTSGTNGGAATSVACAGLPALVGDTTSSAGSCTTATGKTGGVAFAASATTDTTNAANIGSGILPCAREPALTGNVTTSAGSCATTIATVYRRFPCSFAFGDTSGAVLTDAQLGPQKRLCYVPGPATIVEMDVSADGGTPNIVVGVNHAGSVSNIVSSALATAGSGGIACSNTGGTTGLDGATTCSGTLQNTSVTTGDYIQPVSGTAGGTAKLMTVHVLYVLN